MEIKEFFPLAPQTTFHIGGTARYFIDVRSVHDVGEALAFAETKKLPVFILGAGSNILMSDDGYAGVVLHILIDDIEWKDEGDDVFLTAGAGCQWDDIVAMTVARGYWGLENLTGIPGSVGASVVQNIGAYGVEVSSVVTRVLVYDKKNQTVRELSHADCRFGYRDSIWKSTEGKNLVVLSVTYRLTKSGVAQIGYKDLAEYFRVRQNSHPTGSDVREALMEIRGAKFPDLKEHGTAGSFFKNPIVKIKDAETFFAKFPDAPRHMVDKDTVKLSAGWIIDHALNMRGTRDGQAGTWPTQALVMVNYGGAHAEDIRRFAEEIQRRAHDELGITLEPEVIIVEST